MARHAVDAPIPTIIKDSKQLNRDMGAHVCDPPTPTKYVFAPSRDTHKQTCAVRNYKFPDPEIFQTIHPIQDSVHVPCKTKHMGVWRTSGRWLRLAEASARRGQVITGCHSANSNARFKAASKLS